MRILFHHRIASRDGQAVHIEEMIAALRRQGHETILVGPPGLLATGFGGASALVERVKRWTPAALFELLEVAYSVKAFLRLYAAVRTHRPDVIYERFSLFLFAGIWVRRLTGVPVLLEVAYSVKAFLRLYAAVRAHRPDIIYERFSLFLFAGIWVRRLTGVPVLLEVNSPLYEERRHNDGLRLHRLGRWAQRRLWNGVDHVLPVTGVLARMVAGYGVPASRITVIPNGIDPERFSTVPDIAAAKAALGLQPRLVLGFTGFIRGWNAVHRLLDFAAAHREKFDLHVLVVGDGPARDSLQDHAAALGVADRLTITGIVGRDEVARHVCAFDIAVLPGLTPYSSPLKLFEYLQLGRAIAAPDSENIREILTDGHDALLFDPARDGALEAVLLRLCDDAALRARLGEAARRTIAEKSLTWDRNAERVAAIAAAAIRRAAARHPDALARPTRS